jgi:hypothetical protein
MPESIIRRDEEPFLQALIDDRLSGADRKRVRIVKPVRKANLAPSVNPGLVLRAGVFLSTPYWCDIIQSRTQED